MTICLAQHDRSECLAQWPLLRGGSSERGKFWGEGRAQPREEKDCQGKRMSREHFRDYVPVWACWNGSCLVFKSKQTADLKDSNHSPTLGAMNGYSFWFIKCFQVYRGQMSSVFPLGLRLNLHKFLDKSSPWEHTVVSWAEAWASPGMKIPGTPLTCWWTTASPATWAIRPINWEEGSSVRRPTLLPLPEWRLQPQTGSVEALTVVTWASAQNPPQFRWERLGTGLHSHLLLPAWTPSAQSCIALGNPIQKGYGDRKSLVLLSKPMEQCHPSRNKINKKSPAHWFNLFLPS